MNIDELYPVGSMVKILDEGLVSNGGDWPDRFRGAVAEVVNSNNGYWLVVKRPDNIHWAIMFKYIEPYKPFDVPKINLYLHKCPKCKANGRKCGQTFLCSNIKCKTRVSFNKYYRKPIVNLALLGTQDNPINVWCHICGKLAETLSGLDETFNCIPPHKPIPFKLTIGTFYKVKSINNLAGVFRWDGKYRGWSL